MIVDDLSRNLQIDVDIPPGHQAERNASHDPGLPIPGQQADQVQRFEDLVGLAL
jgi:hypothetical protein